MGQLLGKVFEFLPVAHGHVHVGEVACHLEKHAALDGRLHSREEEGIGDELEDALVADVGNLLGELCLGTWDIVPVPLFAIAVVDCFLRAAFLDPVLHEAAFEVDFYTIHFEASRYLMRQLRNDVVVFVVGPDAEVLAVLAVLVEQ